MRKKIGRRATSRPIKMEELGVAKIALFPSLSAERLHPGMLLTHPNELTYCRGREKRRGKRGDAEEGDPKEGRNSQKDIEEITARIASKPRKDTRTPSKKGVGGAQETTMTVYRVHRRLVPPFWGKATSGGGLAGKRNQGRKPHRISERGRVAFSPEPSHKVKR